MKYDFYESFTDGSGEHKVSCTHLTRVFGTETKDAICRMTSDSADIIKKGSLQYWAEEAINEKQNTQRNRAVFRRT